MGMSSDPAEEVALVARAKRDLLLRAHRYQLRREDLEDCFSQATLELVIHARRGGTFADRLHLSNLLSQRFVSRIHDRRRALSGRSPMQAALEVSASLGGGGEDGLDVADVRAELEKLVILRYELRRIGALAHKLSPDQRAVLACQLLGQSCEETCSRYAWSSEKYRKVAQRARVRLGRLVAADEMAVPTSGRRSEESIGTAYEPLSPHS
jgi:DNA-directed RNA polymerase specialized sigma24 family protein